MAQTRRNKAILMRVKCDQAGLARSSSTSLSLKAFVNQNAAPSSVEGCFAFRPCQLKQRRLSVFGNPGGRFGFHVLVYQRSCQ